MTRLPRAVCRNTEMGTGPVDRFRNPNSTPGRITFHGNPDGSVRIVVECPHRVGTCTNCALAAAFNAARRNLELMAAVQAAEETARRLARRCRARGRKRA